MPRLRRFRQPVTYSLIAVATLCALAASFFAGTQIQPPQRDALQAAQAIIPVFAAVQTMAVDSRTAFAGQVAGGVIGNVQATSLPSPAIVTRQGPAAGQTMEAGHLAVVISGEPYFALLGPLPLYRDLKRGDEGDDVKALQTSLTASGITVDVTGEVDYDTMYALRTLYRSEGFSLPQMQEATSPANSGTSAAATASPSPSPPTLVDYIPFGRFLPLAISSATVTSALGVGTVVTTDAPILQLQLSGNYVSFRADPVESGSLKVGDAMTVQANGQTIAVTVATIGAFTDAGNNQLPGRDVSLTSGQPELAALAPGTSVNVLGTGSDTSGLAVPLTAVRQDNDGTYVLMRASGSDPETTTRVPITVDRSGGGWAAISGTTLSDSDFVMVSQ